MNVRGDMEILLDIFKNDVPWYSQLVQAGLAVSIVMVGYYFYEMVRSGFK